MADKKITQLTALTAPANTDLLLIVDDPSGSPVSKKIELGDIFGETAQTVFQTINISASGNTVIGGDVVKITPTTSFEVQGLGDFNYDEIRIRTAQTPASSNNTALGWSVGTISWDTNFLYIAVNGSTIKRVALDTF
jgi:hypothetical protein